jgi:hypothetical protein
VFTPSSSATLFLYRRPGIDSISLQRETVHEQETREGAREASLERMVIAEERVGLYCQAFDPVRAVFERASHMEQHSESTLVLATSCIRS